MIFKKFTPIFTIKSVLTNENKLEVFGVIANGHEIFRY